MLAFLTRETLGATIMALISFSWLANSLIDLTTQPTSTNATRGLLALSLAAILLLVGVGALLGKSLLGAVIALASARFATGGLPIGRRGAARRAFEDDLGEQVGPVESEAGVRKQL